MEEFTVKYRNGVPTKDSIGRLCAKYFPENIAWKVSTGSFYGKPNNKYNFILWSNSQIQESILGFIDFLADLGIECEKYEPYESPRVGSFNIIKKEKK